MTLKREASGKPWGISPKDKRSKTAEKQFRGQIDKATNFWEIPDRINRMRFSAWISQFIEDQLVCDAVPIYKHPTMAGDLFALRGIDPATIKLLIDQYGTVVGYQQILYGYPATQYGVYGKVVGEIEPAHMEYVVTNPTSNGTYGRSALEELKPLMDLAARRMLAQLNWYTEGSVPVAVLAAPPEWSPEQIAQGQNYLNNMLAGNDKERARIFLIPTGAGAHGGAIQQLKPFQFTKDETEWIGRVVASGFGIEASLFVAQVNRATAEAQQNQSTDVGLRPILNTIANFINDITQNDLGCPDVEFAWVERQAGTELTRAQARTLDINSGFKTANEFREEEGLEALEEPEPVAAPAALPPNANKPDGKAESQPAPDDVTAAKAELSQWRRFAEKRLAKGRQADAFETEDVPAHVAAMVREGLSKGADVRETFEAATLALTKSVRLTASKRKNYERALESVVARRLKSQRAAAVTYIEGKVKDA